MDSNSLRNLAEPEVLGGDGIANADAFPSDASTTTSNLDSHTISQIATDQDLAENNIGDAIPVHTCSPPRSDSPDSGVLSLRPGQIVMIEGLPESLRPGDRIRVTSIPIADRGRSWPYSLPRNVKDAGGATSRKINADGTMGSGPRIIHTHPSLHNPSTPLESLLRNVFMKADRPGNIPGSSVVGDCIICWKPSVVPQLFEFKYWFKQFKKKCVFLVQDHHFRRESPVSL